jgi:hypothetical protein
MAGGGHLCDGNSFILLFSTASWRVKTPNCLVQWLVTAYLVPTSLIFSTLKMEMILSSETSVLTKASRRHISEVDVLQIHRRENLKPYLYSKAIPVTDRGGL